MDSRLAPSSTGEPDFAVPAPPLVHADVHAVAAHPSTPDLVFAATAEGLYRSRDGGATWTVLYAGAYCRAVWVDPQDPAHIVLGPADDVEQNGRIEETHDAGTTWTGASAGLEVPWRHALIERFVPIGEELLAITNQGMVYAAPRATLRWQQILTEAGRVHRMAQDPA